MISLKRFQNLKDGDVVLWKSKRGNYLRTIVQAPQWGPNALPSHSFITMTIRRRSWTNRATTVRNWEDVKRRIIKVVKRTKKVCLPIEVQVLRDIGFNPKREFVREVREEIALKKRMGRRLCAKIRKLPAL